MDEAAQVAQAKAMAAAVKAKPAESKGKVPRHTHPPAAPCLHLIVACCYKECKVVAASAVCVGGPNICTEICHFVNMRVCRLVAHRQEGLTDQCMLSALQA